MDRSPRYGPARQQSLRRQAFSASAARRRAGSTAVWSCASTARYSDIARAESPSCSASRAMMAAGCRPLLPTGMSAAAFSSGSKRGDRPRRPAPAPANCAVKLPGCADEPAAAATSSVTGRAPSPAGPAGAGSIDPDRRAGPRESDRSAHRARCRTTGLQLLGRPSQSSRAPLRLPGPRRMSPAACRSSHPPCVRHDVIDEQRCFEYASAIVSGRVNPAFRSSSLSVLPRSSASANGTSISRPTPAAPCLPRRRKSPRSASAGRAGSTAAA